MRLELQPRPQEFILVRRVVAMGRTTLTQEPMQTEDISSLDLSLRSDEDAFSVTHGDGAVPEVLP
ncbi:hypothetical protein AMELA_G00071180, partial [Ameiurus melas]